MRVCLPITVALLGLSLTASSSLAESSRRESVAKETEADAAIQNQSILRGRDASDAEAPTTQSPAAVATQPISPEARAVVQQMEAFTRRFQQEEQQLNQRLAQAQRLMERGIAENNYSMIQQAEQYQRQALNYYEQKIKHLEQWSRQYAEQAANATNQVPQAAQPQAPMAPVRSYAPSYRSSGRPRLFGRR